MHAKSNNEQKPELEQYAKRLDLLRDQVDILQVEQSERRKAWYHEPSLIVSAVALVVTIIVNIFTFKMQNAIRSQDEINRRVKMIHESLSGLTGVEESMAALAQEPFHFQNAGRGSAVSARKALYVDVVDRLIETTREHTTPMVSAMLGGELMSIGRYDEAEVMLESGVAAAEKTRDKEAILTLYRQLGALHYIPKTAIYQLDVAKEYFERALKCDADKEDDFSLFSTGNTLFAWAGSAIQAEQWEDTEELLNRAEKTALKMNAHNANRDAQLAMIERAREYLRSIKVGRRVISQGLLHGKWIVEFPENDPRSGEALCSFNPTMQEFGCTVYVREGKRLTAKWRGPGRILAPWSFELDFDGIKWVGSQGRMLGPMPPIVQVNGELILSAASVSTTLEGELRILGEEPISVTLRKGSS